MTKKKPTATAPLKPTTQLNSSPGTHIDLTAFHKALNKSTQRKQLEKDVLSQRFAASIARAREREHK
jgi:hypothetical protein